MAPSTYFNSQPHEEADLGVLVVAIPLAHFNSQPHEEADGLTYRSLTGLSDISTHSLTKRLTEIKKLTFSEVYISTHSLTKRLTGVAQATGDISLISTHSLTKRLTAPGTSVLLMDSDFNSQPHEEADWPAGSKRRKRRYFNSQPHEEADVSEHGGRHFITIFQLTASRRG